MFARVSHSSLAHIATTGEALFPSCRSTADLLARNLLDAVGVWWFPGMILQVTGLLLSGLWGGAVFGASYAYWGRSQVGGAWLGGAVAPIAASACLLACVRAVWLSVWLVCVRTCVFACLLALLACGTDKQAVKQAGRQADREAVYCGT